MEDENRNQQDDFVGLPQEIESTERSNEIRALTNNIAQLERSLDTEKEARLEERFTLVCAICVLVDIVAVSAVDGSWLFLPIFMLQLVALIGFAQKCGVDWAVQGIGWLLHRISKLKSND